MVTKKNHLKYRKITVLLGWMTLLLLSGCNAGRSVSTLADSTEESQQAYWSEIAPMCGGYPSKANCDDGDMTLFAGLLCASGEKRGCEMVRNSQGTDGRWWRSPRRNPGNNGERHSFSRDMSMGVLLYLATTRDSDAALKWLNWIEDSRPCVVTNPLTRDCIQKGLGRYCTDDDNATCTITPGNWALMGRVWETLGLAKSSEMKLSRGMDGDISELEVQHTPLGYQLHLEAVDIYIKQILGVAESSRQAVAKVLQDRQPDNPFFSYLNGSDAAAIANSIHNLCPMRGLRDGGSHNQWSWERDTASQAFKDSMGWDCIFLNNLLHATK